MWYRFNAMVVSSSLLVSLGIVDEQFMPASVSEEAFISGSAASDEDDVALLQLRTVGQRAYEGRTQEATHGPPGRPIELESGRSYYMLSMPAGATKAEFLHELALRTRTGNVCDNCGAVSTSGSHTTCGDHIITATPVANSQPTQVVVNQASVNACQRATCTIGGTNCGSCAEITGQYYHQGVPVDIWMCILDPATAAPTRAPTAAN
eukprot:gnl/TRDRNA2_/TRDRNA2_202786_c0_seq1.p1 gnl/TRDRNA2_/TRDRNA2_202786_c0~~gnl/TRDRNA2_/TRDRNA2_202786_c0_seq1.p1  ORF type:complete len:207 (-),score=8.24 gnl/TRDRNA2_/TRDRNA2_202786_c0_seq1:230-850(-)